MNISLPTLLTRYCLLLPLLVAVTPSAFAQSADAAYKAALATWSGGNQIKTEALLDEYTRRYPSNEKLALFRAACARSRFDIGTADSLFLAISHRVRKAGGNYSPQAECAVLMAALDKQRYPEASFALLEKLVARTPKDPIPLWLLAMADRTYGRRANGIAAYHRLLRIAPPGSPVVHQSYANLLEESGRHAEALVSRQKAAWGEPTAANVNALGKTLISLRRYEEAITLFQKATQSHPSDASVWNGLGKALIERQRYPEAVEALSRADTLNSGDPDTLYWWGLSLEKQGNYPDALAKYKKSLEAKPNAPRTRAHIADVLDRLGLRREAQEYRTGVEVNTKKQ